MLAELELWDIIRDLLASLCHQLPERSFGGDSFMAPLCYRCSAFYAAYVASLTTVVASRANPRPMVSLVLGSLLVAVLGADVYLVYSTNISRVTTGLLAGAGAGLVSGGFVHRHLRQAMTRSPTTTWWLAWVALVTILSLGPLALGLPEASAVLSVLGVATVVITVPTIFIVNLLQGWRTRSEISARKAQ